ncbi:adhesion G-protein coupled receptor G7-like isoform X2 [Oscarella lobularis]
MGDNSERRIVPGAIESKREEKRVVTKTTSVSSHNKESSLLVIVPIIGVIVAFAVSFAPFVVVFAFPTATNKTHVNRTNIRLKELLSLNDSTCPDRLAPNRHGSGGCIVPCSVVTWFIHPIERVSKDVIICVQIVVALSAAVIFTSVWIKLRKSHCKFPHILPWYLLLTSATIGVLDLISIIIGDERIICNSENIMDSVQNDNPTTSCRVIGSLFHYLVLAQTFWFTVSAANMWWTICYPTRSRYFLENSTRVHIIESLFCWLFPAALLAVNLAFEKTYRPVSLMGYCMPPTEALFLTTFVLPLDVSSFVLLALLTNLIYTLRKHDRFRKKTTIKKGYANGNKKKLSEIEKLKIGFVIISLVVTVFTLLFGVSSVLSIVTRDKAQLAFTEHLICLLETSSTAANLSSCPETFHDFQYPVLTLLTECVSVLAILAIVRYALTIKGVRNQLFGWFKCRTVSRQSNETTVPVN